MRPAACLRATLLPAALVLCGCGPAAHPPDQAAPGPDPVGIAAPDQDTGGLRLQPGTRTYQRLTHGAPAGEAISTLTREDGGWVARTRLDATGSMAAGLLQEVEEFRFADVTAWPVASRHTQTQGPAGVEVDLRWLGTRVEGRVRLPSGPGEQEIGTELPAGTLLSGMEEFFLAAADLREGWRVERDVYRPLPPMEDFARVAGELRQALRDGRPPEPSELDLTIGRSFPVTYRVTGTEDITVPAGTFSAYRVEATGGEQPRTIFVRRDPPHVMLRQEIPGVVLELTGMQRAP